MDDAGGPSRSEQSGPTGPVGLPTRSGDRPPWLGIALGLAILLAPFLALLYGIEAGLAVMAVALAAVGLLAVLSARTADPDLRQRLVLVGAVNAILAFACLLLLLVRA